MACEAFLDTGDQAGIHLQQGSSNGDGDHMADEGGECSPIFKEGLLKGFASNMHPCFSRAAWSLHWEELPSAICFQPYAPSTGADMCHSRITLGCSCMKYSHGVREKDIKMKCKYCVQWSISIVMCQHQPVAGFQSLMAVVEKCLVI